MPYRQSQWRTDVVVGGFHLGLADKWDGGDKSADTTTYPRASGDVALGGKATRADGTATYLYDEQLHAIFKALDSGVGSLNARITRTPTGDDGTPFPGGAFTLTGHLKAVPMPAGDYGSNDGATVDLQFALDTALA
jgi:hypothetical protein